MTDTFQCPACGGLIEYTSNNQDMPCPFCGTAITTPGAGTAPAAATVVVPKIEGNPGAAAQTMIQHSRFNNSAEIMDEIKRLLREDDKSGAVKVYRKEFNVPLADARSSVDQIEIDMRHSGKETPPPPTPVESAPPPAPAPSEPAVSGDVVFDGTPQKPSSTKNWIIGCSIAAVVFCCCCVILPTLIFYVRPLLGF